MQAEEDRYSTPLGGYFHNRGGYGRLAGMRAWRWKKGMSQTPTVQDESPDVPVKSSRVPGDKTKLGQRPHVTKGVGITQPEMDVTNTPGAS